MQKAEKPYHQALGTQLFIVTRTGWWNVEKGLQKAEKRYHQALGTQFFIVTRTGWWNVETLKTTKCLELQKIASFQ